MAAGILLSRRTLLTTCLLQSIIKNILPYLPQRVTETDEFILFNFLEPHTVVIYVQLIEDVPWLRGIEKSSYFQETFQYFFPS